MSQRRPNFSARHLCMLGLTCLVVAGWGVFCMKLTRAAIGVFNSLGGP